MYRCDNRYVHTFKKLKENKIINRKIIISAMIKNIPQQISFC